MLNSPLRNLRSTGRHDAATDRRERRARTEPPTRRRADGTNALVEPTIWVVVPFTLPLWRARAGPVAEAVARILVGEGLPTPMTQTNRSAGRDPYRKAAQRKRTRKRVAERLLPPACRYCGVILERGRRVCDECLAEYRRERSFPFADAGPAALARHRAEGRDPTAAPKARAKQGKSMSQRNQE